MVAGKPVNLGSLIGCHYFWPRKKPPPWATVTVIFYPDWVSRLGVKCSGAGTYALVVIESFEGEGCKTNPLAGGR